MLDINLMKQIGTIKKYGPDEYVFREGEAGEEMYIILSGKAEVYINSIDGYPLKVSTISSGGFFGEMSLLEGLPRSASVIAAEDTLALVIHKDNFLTFISKQPTISYNIMKELSSRVRGLNNELKNHHEAKTPPQKAVEAQHPVNTISIEPGSLADTLYPIGYKYYDTPIPSADEQYLYEKEIKCPVCGKSFKALVQKVSKLKLDKVELDFRQKYKDFEPLWYSIWICPHCLYSNHCNEFENISGTYIKPIFEKLSELRKKLDIKFTEPHNINRILDSYYLTLYCSKLYPVPPFKPARLWMHLSWIYQDLGDENMFQKASGQALQFYSNAVFNNSRGLSSDQEQQCLLVLGELCLRTGDYENAYKHFRSAMKDRNGRSSYLKQAEDRILYIKNNLPDTTNKKG